LKGNLVETENGFEWALVRMKAGYLVARAGWNGKGMWLLLVRDLEQLDYRRLETGWSAAVKSLPALSPFIVMFTAQGTLIPWLASQTDLLATDWETVT
jgi:hypothetical protein